MPITNTRATIASAPRHAGERHEWEEYTCAYAHLSSTGRLRLFGMHACQVEQSIWDTWYKDEDMQSLRAGPSCASECQEGFLHTSLLLVCNAVRSTSISCTYLLTPVQTHSARSKSIHGTCSHLSNWHSCKRACCRQKSGHCRESWWQSTSFTCGLETRCSKN